MGVSIWGITAAEMSLCMGTLVRRMDAQKTRGAGELEGGSGRSVGMAFGACSMVRTLASLLRETRAKERLLSRGVGEWDNRPQSQKTQKSVGDNHRP